MKMTTIQAANDCEGPQANVDRTRIPWIIWENSLDRGGGNTFNSRINVTSYFSFRYEL